MTTDDDMRAAWEADVKARAQRLAAYWHDDYTAPGTVRPISRDQWFDPGVMGPRDEDRADYDYREDCDPSGDMADWESARVNGA